MATPKMDFNQVLGSLLYPNALERERLTLYGKHATCTLYSVTPSDGEQEVIELATGWLARRIPTIESGAIEQWRLEVVNEDVTWPMVTGIATVRINSPETGEVQHYKVVQVENAMKPGHIYHLRLEAIDQTWP